MTALIPHLCVSLLALMVFALCYALACRDGRIEAQDNALRAMTDACAKALAERDARIAALQVENVRLLKHIRIVTGEAMDAGELIAEWERIIDDRP